MSDQMKFRLAVSAALVLAVLLAALLWARDHEREKHLEGVLAQAAKERGDAIARSERLQDEQAWAKVLETAEALNDPGLKDGARAEAFGRFRAELLKVKSRFAYRQLGPGR